MPMLPISRRAILALSLALLSVSISTTLAFAQSTFTIVSSPSPGKLQNELHGVSAISNTDVWAVGFSNSFYVGASDLGDRTLAEHWNGSKWSIVRSPNVSTHSNDANFLTSVSALATNDVWAVGSSNVNNASVDEPLAEHWNGSNWSIVSVPTTHTGENLFAVSVDAPNDVWAVGQFTDYKPYFKGGPVIHHWNGSVWSDVAVPAGVIRVDGVAALSNTNAWAIGATQILHWNGSTWSIFPIHFTQGYTVLFSSISAASTSDIWVTGGILGKLARDHFLHILMALRGSFTKIPRIRNSTMKGSPV